MPSYVLGEAEHVNYENDALKSAPVDVFEDLGIEPPPPSRKGNFDWSTARPVIEIKDIPNGKHVEDFNSWAYQYQDFRIDVDFDGDGKVNEIACFTSRSYSDNSAQRFSIKGISFCPKIFGLGDGDTEEKIYGLLGKPNSENINGVAKTIEYNDFNLWLNLTKKEVYMLGIKQH